MLVDLVEPIPVDETTAKIQALLHESMDLRRLSKGLYTGPSILQEVTESDDPFLPYNPPEGVTRDDWLKEIIRRLQDGTYPSDYGVVDHPPQIVERFPRIEKDPRPFVILFHEIRREDQSPQGGWRWHKWGPYYGVRKPRCEYLYDEPQIDAVWVYSIYHVKEGCYQQ